MGSQEGKERKGGGMESGEERRGGEGGSGRSNVYSSLHSQHMTTPFSGRMPFSSCTSSSDKWRIRPLLLVS